MNKCLDTDNAKNRLLSLLLICLALGISACATKPAYRNVIIDPDKLSEELAKPPYIEKLVDVQLSPKSSESEIEVYYRVFNLLNTPREVIDWESLYVIDSGKTPEWEYTEIANVNFFLRNKYDKTAIKKMRQLARELGGDAVIDLYRLPATSKYAKNYTGRVYAYMYLGTVVTRKGKE